MEKEQQSLSQDHNEDQMSPAEPPKKYRQRRGNSFDKEQLGNRVPGAQAQGEQGQSQDLFGNIASGWQSDEKRDQQEAWKGLLGVHASIDRIIKLSRSSHLGAISSKNNAPASAEASERYERHYKRIELEAKEVQGQIAGWILAVSDGRGNPTTKASTIERYYAKALRLRAALRVDLEAGTVSGRNKITVSNARDAISAAKSARGLLIKSSVTLLKVGIVSMGCPPQAANYIADGYRVFLDSADHIVGERFILQGKTLSAKQMQAVFIGNLLKRVVWKLDGKILGHFLENSYIQQLVGFSGGSIVGNVLSGMIDRAFIQWGPTLTPSMASIGRAFEESFQAHVKSVEGMASLDFSDPGFVKYLANTALALVGTACGNAVKKDD